MPRHSFRDFLYNKNDIILAIVVIVAALVIIAWRLDIIMDYPSTIDTDTTQEFMDRQQEEKDTSAVTGDTSGGNGEESAASASDTTPEEAATTATFVDGKLAEDVKVVVAEGKYDISVQSLIDARLFDSKAEFEAECKSANVKPADIKPGIYTFVKDSTKAIIVQQLTK